MSNNTTCRICDKSRQSKYSNFNDIKIMFFSLITFFSFIVFVLLKSLNNYQSSSEAGDVAEAQFSVLDMQVATLTITGIAITLVAVIISMLVIYRDRRIAANDLAIEDSLKALEKAKVSINILTNINAIQILGSRHSECYYDAIEQYLKATLDDENNLSTVHFRIALVNIYSALSETSDDSGNALKCCDEIIRTTELILKDDSSSGLDKHFAYMEALHSLYVRAKNTIQTNPNSAQDDLDKAFKYLDKVSEINAKDSFGHIHNLYGLIYLWSAISNIRTNHKLLLASSQIETAIENFNVAIRKNSKKVEFINHLGVALLNKYELDPTEANYDAARITYLKCIKIDSNYHKANLNLASLTIKRIQSVCKIPLPAKLSKHKLDPMMNEELSSSLLADIDNAEKHLYVAQKSVPNFPNNFYKLAELLTYKLWLLERTGAEMATKPDLISKIRKTFIDSNNINQYLLACKYCERNFYELIGDTEEAKKANSAISEKNPKNAANWIIL